MLLTSEINGAFSLITVTNLVLRPLFLIPLLASAFLIFVWQASLALYTYEFAISGSAFFFGGFYFKLLAFLLVLPPLAPLFTPL